MQSLLPKDTLLRTYSIEHLFIEPLSTNEHQSQTIDRVIVFNEHQSQTIVSQSLPLNISLRLFIEPLSTNEHQSQTIDRVIDFNEHQSKTIISLRLLIKS